MFERCEEKSADLLLDELLNKGIIIDDCLLWRPGGNQLDEDSETRWQAFGHKSMLEPSGRWRESTGARGTTQALFTPAIRSRSQQRGLMPELIHEFKNPVKSRNGARYSVLVYGERRSDGTWEGHLEFRPENGLTSMRTGRETTQPDRNALAYWASGLEPIYLEGALDRAVKAEGR